MADVPIINLTNITVLLSASASLGAASMSLVDALKVFGGGPSRFGFGYVEEAIGPFLPPAGQGSTAGSETAFGRNKILRTLKANWINGVAKADQKAKAKSLIHLGLTPDNATNLAKAAGVDGEKLRALAIDVANGMPPAKDEINVLGQFDVVLSAVLDAAYERGDQKYRNSCKALAVPISTALGVLGGWVIFPDSGYFWSPQIVMSALVGISSVPIAPVSKDLASAIQAAAAAVSPFSLKRT